ncbi:Alpha/Beta hydrolase protein, partial [Fennellomyces sp. T-0311]
AYLHWRYFEVSDTFRKIVSRNIQYSDADSFCKLDVYHPERTETNAPIILFIHGGGWSSGSKLLYTSMANTLRELGYIVVVPDYRKYPKGHSAGAHLCAQVMLENAIDNVKQKKADALPPVKGILLLAGVYSIERHVLTETGRGIEKISGMTRVMGQTPENLRKNSPINLVEANGEMFAKSDELLKLIPRIMLVHGEKDTTVLPEQSVDMYNTFTQVLPPERRDDVDVRLRIHKRLKHAQCVIALMPNLLGEDRYKKALVKDIQDFIGNPQNPQ